MDRPQGLETSPTNSPVKLEREKKGGAVPGVRLAAHPALQYPENPVGDNLAGMPDHRERRGLNLNVVASHQRSGNGDPSDRGARRTGETEGRTSAASLEYNRSQSSSKKNVLLYARSNGLFVSQESPENSYSVLS